MKYVYPAIFTPNELGGYSVEFPDFPVGGTDGDNLEDAIYMASEFLELAIEGETELGHKLPKSSTDLKVGKDQKVLYLAVDANSEDALVPSKDAAQMLSVTPSRVRQLISTGQLVGEKRGRDNYIYLWSVKKRLASSRSVGRPRKIAVS